MVFCGHWRGVVGWRGVGHVLTFKWTCGWRTCYCVAATVSSLELSTHAGSCVMLRHCKFSSTFHSCVMLRYCKFSWTFHSCVMQRYCQFSWTFHSCVMLRYCKFSWTFHLCVMLRYCKFSWTFHASLDAHKKQWMWPWDACWLRMPGQRHAGPPRKSNGSGLGVAFACAGSP